jgi:hypothetical protein
VIRGKYGRGAANFPTAVAKPSDSSFWKALASFLPWLEENSCRVIGNGRSTQAWDMCWIEPGFRIVNLEVDIPAEMRNARVVDLVTDNGCWNWQRLSWIPCNILNKLLAS